MVTVVLVEVVVIFLDPQREDLVGQEAIAISNEVKSFEDFLVPFSFLISSI